MNGVRGRSIVAWVGNAIVAGLLALAPATDARACGGMTQIDPPSLQLIEGPVDVAGLVEPQHECAIRLGGVTTLSAPREMSCGCGVRTLDSVVDELQGVVVLAHGTLDPFVGYPTFAPNPATTAQLGDPADPFAGPQAPGESWLGATGTLSAPVVAGAEVDFLFLVNVAEDCSALRAALEQGNAFVVGATSPAGLFGDPSDFSSVESLALLARAVPALGAWGLLGVLIAQGLVAGAAMARRARARFARERVRF